MRIYRAGRWPTFTGVFRVQTEPGGRPGSGGEQPSEAVRHPRTAGGGGEGVAVALAVAGSGRQRDSRPWVQGGSRLLGMALARECTGGQEAGGTRRKAFLRKLARGSQGQGGHSAGGQLMARIVGLTRGKTFWSEAGALKQLLARLGHLVHEQRRSKQSQNRSNIGDGRDGYHLEHTVKDQ